MYDRVFIFYQSKMCGWLNATRATFKSAIETAESLCEFQQRVIRVLSSRFTYRTYSCVLRFVRVFIFVLLKNYSFSLSHDASNVHTTRESLNKN